MNILTLLKIETINYITYESLYKIKKIVGYAPTVLEINYLSKYFDSIFHIAVLQKDKKVPKNTIEYNSEK